MTAAGVIRRALPDDAQPMGAVKNAWIEATAWMPRIHLATDVVRHYRDHVIPNREVWVRGKPVQGYIALDNENYVTSLFCQPQGIGTGKALLDHAKTLRRHLKLWTFEANTGARRFYAREGFSQIDRSDGDNEENLADVLLEWRAA